MQIKIKKSFSEVIDNINTKKILAAIFNTINEIENASSIKQIKNIKKLHGHDNYYRIRIGDYRIGIFYENPIITVVCFLHRKDIYKYFP